MRQLNKEPRGHDGNAHSVGELVPRSDVLADAMTTLRLLRIDVRVRANRAFNFLIVFTSVAAVAVSSRSAGR